MNRKRHEGIVDIWSIPHILWGITLVMLFPPVIALVLLAAWEPLENFILSPLLWKHFKINFGYESLGNALFDIVCDAIGIGSGLLIMAII